jgi:hypothetical protein
VRNWIIWEVEGETGTTNWKIDTKRNYLQMSARTGDCKVQNSCCYSNVTASEIRARIISVAFRCKMMIQTVLKAGALRAGVGINS